MFLFVILELNIQIQLKIVRNKHDMVSYLCLQFNLTETEVNIRVKNDHLHGAGHVARVTPDHVGTRVSGFTTSVNRCRPLQVVTSGSYCHLAGVEDVDHFTITTVTRITISHIHNLDVFD